MKLRKQLVHEERFILAFLPQWFGRLTFRPGSVVRAVFRAGVEYGRRMPRFRSRIRTRGRS